MDILFLVPSTYGDPNANEWHPDLRYSVNFLRQHGLDVGYFAPALLFPPEQIIDRIEELDPAMLFVNLTIENVVDVTEFLKILRERMAELLLLGGGVPATLDSEKLFSLCPELHLLVTNERESTLKEILVRHRSGQSIDTISGIITADFGNDARPLMIDLDALGMMIHDDLDSLVSTTPEEYRVGYLLSSRGCYARCSFCAVPDFYNAVGKRWRGRSVEIVVDELKLLKKKYKIHYFVFQDDNFFGPGGEGQQRAYKLAQTIIDRKLDIRFFFCCRLNDVQPETFTLLRQAGLVKVGIGIESLHQESLSLFEKAIDQQNIYPTMDFLNELGVTVEVNMIFFNPYIDLDGVRANLAFLEYIRSKKNLCYSTAFPFNELKAFQWSRVASRLYSEGLLDTKNMNVSYRDPRVGQLAKWVRQIHQLLPMTFKHRYVFEGLDTLKVFSAESKLLFLAGCRQWVGMYLFPRYVEQACDLIEAGVPSLESDLEAMRDQLLNEFKKLKVFASSKYVNEKKDDQACE